MQTKHHEIDGTNHNIQVTLSVCVVPFAVGRHGLDVALWSHTPDRDELALVRGTLQSGEHLTECATRIAKAALGILPDYLEQLYTFSLSGDETLVTVAYFALLSAETRATIESNGLIVLRHVDQLGNWSAIDQHILDYAKMRLRAKLGYSNIGFHLLPREFTMSELQDVYESIIGQRLDKRNFRRRILAAGIVEPTGGKRSTNHRPAALYRFSGGDPATGALTPADLDWST